MKSKGREPFRMGDTLVKAGETTRVHLPIADHFGIGSLFLFGLRLHFF